MEWSVRYLPDFRLPDKALDLVDQACAVVRFATLSPVVEEVPSGETPLARPAARRTHPYSVVLFDEIEKAHRRVLDLFLQVFDNCRMPWVGRR